MYVLKHRFAVFRGLRTSKTVPAFARSDTLYSSVTCTRKYITEGMYRVEYGKISNVFFTPLLMDVITIHTATNRWQHG
jgi:hypothetical protein